MHANTRKTNILATMIALAATTGFAATAQAGDASAGHYESVVVSYSDLDLNTAAGNKALYARLSSAAERACGRTPATRDLELKAQYRSCVENKLNRAVDKVGSHEMHALHRTTVARRAG